MTLWHGHCVCALDLGSSALVQPPHRREEVAFRRMEPPPAGDAGRVGLRAAVPLGRAWRAVGRQSSAADRVTSGLPARLRSSGSSNIAVFAPRVGRDRRSYTGSTPYSGSTEIVSMLGNVLVGSAY